MTGGGGNARPRVAIRTPFERFPATVKGAFVLRGADPEPHLVRLVEAAVRRIPRGPARPMALGDLTVDVAPARDLFVPFEVSLADLRAGWYTIGARFEVDGDEIVGSTSRPFVQAWEAGASREGVVPLRARVGDGEAAVEVERVELRPEAALVAWRPAARAAAEIVLLADGAPLEPLPPETLAELSPGRGRQADEPAPAIFYPVPVEARSVGVVVRTVEGRSAPLDVPLP